MTVVDIQLMFNAEDKYIPPVNILLNSSALYVMLLNMFSKQLYLSCKKMRSVSNNKHE